MHSLTLWLGTDYNLISAGGIWSCVLKNSDGTSGASCSLCGKVFTDYRNCGRHVKNIHYGMGRKSDGIQYWVMMDPQQTCEIYTTKKMLRRLFPVQ